MSDKALKVVPAPEARAAPDAPNETTAVPAGKPSRKRLRMILLIVLPLIALVGGSIFYLLGGRYIGTDNAYIGAQKVLITPDISGKIVTISVKEGQHVNPGDTLFEFDQTPYRHALDQAKSKVTTAQTDYDKAKLTLASLDKLVELSQKNADIKQRDVDRKEQLQKSQAGSAADVDTAVAALVTAQLELQFTTQQRNTTLGLLLNNRDLPLADFPEYTLAKAQLDQAQRDFDHTTIRAPISGTATQVDSIQLGRYVMAGTPVFSVIDDQSPWVDANPKETDITYLRPGQKVTIDVDSFPDTEFTGTVASVSPGTGAQFSILPAQNASGNWVKVVQRVPVRITFDKTDALKLLRAGMSVTVSIDTHHSRLWGHAGETN